MGELSRRGLLGAVMAGGVAAGGPARGDPFGRVWQAVRDEVTIAWPCDVPGWDPGRRLLADAQPLYKMVFDQPLERDGRLGLEAGLAEAWELAPDGRSLELVLREGVAFHDGVKVTSADLRWSFLERFREGPGADAGRAWRQVVAIETPDARRAVMRFAGPAPGAPAWLAHLGGFVVARHAMGRAVGTGPFRLVEHHAGARLVLERNEAWWGPRPALRRVVVEVIPEAAARVAAVQAGRVDLAAGLPVREVARLGGVPGLEPELSSLSRLVLLVVRDDGGFADRNVRLAAHHAIDKAALAQAFAHGVAEPLSLVAAPGSAGFDDDFLFPHDPNLAILLLEKAGHSLARPARVRLAATRGLFAGDYDMARAIVAMWRRVGIEAVLEVVDAARQMELARAGRLPEAALWSFDGGAEPETGLGALLDPEMPFAPEADAVLARQAAALAGVADAAARAEGWQALGRAAVAAGACVPLLQGVQALVRRQALSHRAYGNGWVLPQTMAWL